MTELLRSSDRNPLTFRSGDILKPLCIKGGHVFDIALGSLTVQSQFCIKSFLSLLSLAGATS